eukprot:COSAG01_NODE_61801_length_287_cov_3.127660_1_plen_47_part_10
MIYTARDRLAVNASTGAHNMRCANTLVTGPRKNGSLARHLHDPHLLE